MIKLIVDSTAYVDKAYAEANDITILPLTITIQDKEFDDTDVSRNDEFFALMKSSGEYPKSSQPNIQVITDSFNKILNNGDEAVVLTISQNLSGTFSTCNMIKKELDSQDKITIIDSESTGQTIYFYVMEVVEMVKKGKSRKEILDRITSLKKESFIQFTPESLAYLKMGGRIGKINAILGSLLQIKPILCFKNNVLNCVKKTMGMKKAMVDMIARIPESVKKIFVIQTAKSSNFDDFKATIQNKFKNAEIFEGQIGPAVGTHVGPAIGVACLVENI